MNFYKRHIGDYIKDAGHLKLLEHGVYARLMDVYYTRESGIPEDKAARLIGASTRPELDALKNVLDEFFILIDGIWIQKRCEEEIEVANSKAEKNRENGSKGGRPKRNQTEDKPNGNPSGFDSVNENNLSQTPDSRHQTPEVKAAAGDSTEAGAALSDSGTRIGEVCRLFRRKGINVGPNALHNCPWVTSPKATDELIAEAVEMAKQRKPNAPISVNYVKPIIADLLAKAEAESAPRPKDWL